MAFRFNLADWYWLADDGRVWSSRVAAIVPSNDQAYMAWVGAGNGPSPWPTDASGAQTSASLQEVLSPYGLWADLKAYANAKQWAKASGGYLATINGAQVPISTSTESLGLIAGKVARLQQANPPSSVQWQTGESTFVTIAAGDFIAASIEIADFVQATFDKLAAVMAKIDAGVITTFAQVDAGLA
ncbi:MULTISPECIES: DUF4376 domain-containing protein [unclassified Bradyrhizobium]|uniref:DUF4376 domain-containing protein n=1 Tax=unclassified Bradyrhizobium TaxID=2631580 RepID=UPI0028EC797A|nr:MULTISPECIES: DUF4376 domain-containing protein [unclassified Bradyrhizobium]